MFFKIISFDSTNISGTYFNEIENYTMKISHLNLANNYMSSNRYVNLGMLVCGSAKKIIDRP